MKVIQNNYKNIQRNKYQLSEKIKPKPKVEKVKIECENCGSVLEVSREDTHIGWLGLPHVKCPCCNYEMDVEEFEDDAIDICASNVKYPTHFTVSSKDFRAVEIPDEEINEWIQEGIQYFRENPEEYSFFMGSGNSMVHIYKFDEDKEYYVIVSKNYESGEIEFEDDDYVSNETLIS